MLFSHHIGLPAATVAALSGSILWAGLIGICCALLGELLSRLFLVHGDTHIAPLLLPFLLPPRLFTLLATIGLFNTITLI